jgi:hypothetical protein
MPLEELIETAGIDGKWPWQRDASSLPLRAGVVD